MKKETVAEFLARGGIIKKIPTAAPSYKADNIKSTSNSGLATIVTMDEADLYHGETKKSKVKKKISSSKSIVDMSALPEELRKKYIDGVINAKEQEDNED